MQELEQLVAAVENGEYANWYERGEALAAIWAKSIEVLGTSWQQSQIWLERIKPLLLDSLDEIGVENRRQLDIAEAGMHGVR